jgi:hypothetical protein
VREDAWNEGLEGDASVRAVERISYERRMRKYFVGTDRLGS